MHSLKQNAIFSEKPCQQICPTKQKMDATKTYKDSQKVAQTRMREIQNQ